MVDLVIRQRVSTPEPEEASEAIGEIFGGAALEAVGPLLYEQRSLVDDGITVTRFACSAVSATLRCTGSADLLVIAVRDGRTAVTCRGTVLTLEPQDLALVPFNEPCTLEWSSVAIDLYSFPLSSFVRTLGAAPDVLTVRAPYLTSRSEELSALWRRLADLVTRQVLDRPGVYSNDVVRAQLTDSLTSVTVEAFGLTNQQEDDRIRDEEVVQRADAFIRDHLASPVTVGEIAAAAGVSIRGLQLTFQRRLDRTPIAHLRRARLHAARIALANPSPDASVGGIGRAVGYSNLGRFSAHYRDEFDESPSRTLERHRPSG